MFRFFSLIALALLVLPACAQVRSLPFGWDLNYESLLKKNNVAENELIRVWLKKTKSPAETWLAELRDRSVTSAVLIEYPAFHAAERTTMLLFKTANEAFYWEFVEGSRGGRNEEPVRPEVYDGVVKDVGGWKQLPPKRADELPDQAWPGYMGFLSRFDGNTSSQMLLTVEDFLNCPDRKCEPGKNMAGRVFKALQPILLPADERSYKHKAEVEIARMSPNERVDEYIKEHGHLTDFGDDHHILIQKYLQQDGPKNFPYIITLIDSYNPRRKRDSSSSVSVQIAVGIDEGVVRLRSSADGRLVIEAMTRYAARVRAEYGSESGIDLDLKLVNGTNMKDQAISDGIWLKYRIDISEQELLAFVNYLIKVAPDYPSWSQTEWSMDLKRNKGSSNTHTQGAVVKNPAIYYQHYLKFKRERAKPGR